MNKKTIIMAVITAIGLGLRIFWVAYVPTIQLYDFETFLETASNIWSGNGHSINGNPIAWVGPAYSYALALFHFISGNDNPFNAMILNVILSTATLVMSAFIYAKWFPASDTCQMAAYALTAVFPSLIAYNNVAGTETLFLFLLAALLLIRLYMENGFKQAVALGVVCALAALTKPFMLAYPAVALAMWWMQGKDIKVTLARSIIMTGVMLAVISPWTIRNYMVFDRFILISYNMGYNQIVNNNYANIRGMWMPLHAVPMPEALRAQVDESLADGRSVKEAYELDPLLGAQARHWIVRNPVGFSQLALLRVQRTFFSGAADISIWAMNNWDFYEIGRSPVRNQRHLHFFEGLFSITANVFSAAGLLLMLILVLPYVKAFFCKNHDRRLPAAEGMIFIHIAFFVVVVATFEGQERYAHPVFIFFIFAVVWLMSKVKV